MSIIYRLRKLASMLSGQYPTIASNLNETINSLDDELDTQATKLYKIRKLAGNYKNSDTVSTCELASNILAILDDIK